MRLRVGAVAFEASATFGGMLSVVVQEGVSVRDIANAESKTYLVKVPRRITPEHMRDACCLFSVFVGVVTLE